MFSGALCSPTTLVPPSLSPSKRRRESASRKSAPKLQRFKSLVLLPPPQMTFISNYLRVLSTASAPPSSVNKVEGVMPHFLKQLSVYKDQDGYVQSVFTDMNRQEGLKIDQECSKLGSPYCMLTGLSKVCMLRNRYSNIIPFDRNRVVLADSVQSIPGSNYINASVVNLPHPHFLNDPYSPNTNGAVRQYISTQGPLPNTFGDFWAMILQERSRAIVMVTLEEERGMRKCDRYFPTSEQPNSTYTRPNSTSIHLNLLSEFRFNSSPVPSTFESTFRDAYVKYLRKRYPGIHNDGIRKLLTGLSNVFLRQIRIVRTIAGVAPENWQDGIESWVTYQLQFLGWPDHGVPEDPAEVVSLMEVVEFVRSGAADEEFNTGVVGSTKEGPTVVHCSAGVGRSGTFITVDYVCSEVWRTILSSPNDLNAIKDDIILSTVKWLRTCRVSMVQSVDQFKLCYKGLLCYLDSVCSSSPAEL